jgi:biotin synthase
LFRKLGLNPHQTEVVTGDNEQQQQLEQQIFNADTDQFYNAAAV